MYPKTIAGIVAASFFLPVSPRAQSANSISSRPETGRKDAHLSFPGSPLGIAWGFLYGNLGVKAEQFMPQVRELGGGFTKVYLFWDQVEPQKGKYDWSAVDAFMNQLKAPEEGLISLYSSSQWAAKRSAALLPPSPARNPDDYYRFVNELVKHCHGCVRYWQNDSEPNNPIYWSGTKEEFVAQLKVFHKAVKDADSSAVVVVGGYDGLFGPPGTRPFPNQQAGLDFFDYVLKEGRDGFDLFDLRLYGDSYTIVARVEFMRQKMLALGYNKPIICTEYGGPAFFQFPENRKYFSLLSSWMQSVVQTDQNAARLQDSVGGNQIAELYQRMSSLAPETQMFMLDCAPELEAKYNRIQVRGLVMRNLFAFAAGVQKTLYWQLLDNRDNRHNMMTLMYGKIGLLGYENGALRKRYPTADAFQRMTKTLAGLREVKRTDVPGRPSIFLFEVDRGARGPVFVVWERRDEFTGENSTPVPFDCEWAGAKATAMDALGQTLPTRIADRRLHLEISLTPVFLEPVR
ncbi:MAG TPA: hypothetical protein VNU68_29615 [Verrucomicrobiae bacterium]|nr:hypothetical protein [Verrucomicrobiae bacterium]